MNKLYILILLLALASCRTSKPPTIVSETIVKEKIVETVKDSIIHLPADSAWLHALLACDSVGNVYLSEINEYKSGAKLEIQPPRIINNTLYIQADVDSSEIYLQWKERNTTRDSIRIERYTIEVNKVSGWQWFQIWAGRIALFALGGFFFIRIYNR